MQPPELKPLPRHLQRYPQQHRQRLAVRDATHRRILRKHLQRDPAVRHLVAVRDRPVPVFVDQRFEVQFGEGEAVGDVGLGQEGCEVRRGGEVEGYVGVGDGEGVGDWVEDQAVGEGLGEGEEVCDVEDAGGAGCGEKKEEEGEIGGR